MSFFTLLRKSITIFIVMAQVLSCSTGNSIKHLGRRTIENYFTFAKNVVHIHSMLSTSKRLVKQY